MLEQIDVFTPSEASCALELADLALDDPEGSGYRALIAQDGELGLVGYLSYGETPLTQGTYDLYWIACAPKARGKGAGRLLVAEMENELRQKGARQVRVETSALTEYGPARAFYASLAYREVARLKDFYRPGDDLVVLAKRLLFQSSQQSR
jgi:ribosomal protein S18 acetylase RimI-like enzyme